MSRGSFTGGTGDILPQTLTLACNNNGSDDYDVTNHFLPIPRTGTARNRATVFEILWVDWYLDPSSLLSDDGAVFGFLATSALRSDGDTSTLASFALDCANPFSIAPAIWVNNFTSSGSATYDMPKRVDLTDGNGNGQIVATDRLVLIIGNVGTSVGVNEASCKVGYRMVNVSITEYVGLVQSQIGTGGIQ